MPPHWNPLRWRVAAPPPESRIQTPEATASYFSKAFFVWMNPLMTNGYKRSLVIEDIWTVSDDRRVQSLLSPFWSLFKHEAEQDRSMPLTRALYSLLKRDFLVGGLCQMIASILQVMAPFILRYLIRFASEAYTAMNNGTPPPSTGIGLGYVFGILAIQFIQSICSTHFTYRSMLMGGQARGLLIAAVFEKSTKLSPRAKAGTEPPPRDDGTKWSFDPQGWSNGRIMNLTSTDAARVEQALGTFHLVWASPVAIILTLILLIVNLGYSALPGLAVLVAGIAALTKAMKVFASKRKIINAISDERIQLTHEIMQGIRFVKLFAWETLFYDRLKEIRNRETRALQRLHIIKGAIHAVSMAQPIFANMVVFIVYSVTNHDLQPAVVFSSLALMNSLRNPLNWLPISIGHAADAWTALKRIESFLLAEETQQQEFHDSNMSDAFKVDDADFTWERTLSESPNQTAERGKSSKPRLFEAVSKKLAKEPATQNKNDIDEKFDDDIYDSSISSSSEYEKTFSLRGINMSVQRGELIAVIGSIGSGKSSLLSALAGDMRRTHGAVTVSGTRAFCPQYAWIQNETLRENIVFGRPFDQQWYDTVVEACALIHDFEALPHGDGTEIGERGITLSGGQKQRVNIARAIYGQSEIVLLDDPLSAVDAYVGAHIFQKAIRGLLASKCVILATHQLHVLPHCDRIVRMSEGRIQDISTYDDLSEKEPQLTQVISNTKDKDQPKDVPDTEENYVANGNPDQDLVQDQKQGDASPPGLILADQKAERSVPFRLYADWLRASGHILNGVAVITSLILFRGGNILTSLWLSWWVSNRFHLTNGNYIAIYASLAVIQGLILFFFSMVTSIVGTRASTSMSNDAMWCVLRARMAFFDRTPMGRITHRFSKDVDMMDNTLTDALRQYLIVLSMLVGTFILITAYFYYFVIALAIVSIALVISITYYRTSARELKRFQAVLDGVVFARFGEALVGAPCIRAYGLQQRFWTRINLAIDDMNSAAFLTFSNQRWLALRLDTIGNTLVFAVGILVVTNRFDVSPSISGLILSYSLSMVQIIQITVRYLSEVDNSMSSTERIDQYRSLDEQEGALTLPGVPETWPDQGKIDFEDVSMRYRPDLPLVIDKFSLNVTPGERIGIVGRTGAGKSTIMTTLYRFTELSSGRISVDGLDISKIGLHTLRSRIATIPQDPTLFRGTIRSNLDPLGEHSDVELWEALKQAHLVGKDSDKAVEKETATDSESPSGDSTPVAADAGNTSGSRVHLDSPVDDEGLSYSLGQRQLMALARALVRNARIILIDEGTSSVDTETDDRIQETILNSFRGRTLISIAHRLRTVLLYDRVCVMEAGRIVEIGPPRELWEAEGVFRGMCDSSRITSADFK